MARLRSGHNWLNAHMHRKLKIVLSPQRVPVVRRTRQPSMFFRDVTDTNQSESHSGHQQLRFTRNYMGAWRTWRRPPTSSLLLDWSCRRTRRRRRGKLYNLLLPVVLLFRNTLQWVLKHTDALCALLNNFLNVTYIKVCIHLEVCLLIKMTVHVLSFFPWS